VPDQAGRDRSATEPGREGFLGGRRSAAILGLQRIVGNAAVQRLLAMRAATIIQRDITVQEGDGNGVFTAEAFIAHLKVNRSVDFGSEAAKVEAAIKLKAEQNATVLNWAKAEKEIWSWAKTYERDDLAHKNRSKYPAIASPPLSLGNADLLHDRIAACRYDATLLNERLKDAYASVHIDPAGIERTLKPLLKEIKGAVDPSGMKDAFDGIVAELSTLVRIASTEKLKGGTKVESGKDYAYNTQGSLQDIDVSYVDPSDKLQLVEVAATVVRLHEKVAALRAPTPAAAEPTPPKAKREGIKTAQDDTEQAQRLVMMRDLHKAGLTYQVEEVARTGTSGWMQVFTAENGATAKTLIQHGINLRIVGELLTPDLLKQLLVLIEGDYTAIIPELEAMTSLSLVTIRGNHAQAWQSPLACHADNDRPRTVIKQLLVKMPGDIRQRLVDLNSSQEGRTYKLLPIVIGELKHAPPPPAVEPPRERPKKEPKEARQPKRERKVKEPRAKERQQGRRGGLSPEPTASPSPIPLLIATPKPSAEEEEEGEEDVVSPSIFDEEKKGSGTNA
jgi:hypothetical protein